MSEENKNLNAVPENEAAEQAETKAETKVETKAERKAAKKAEKAEKKANKKDGKLRTALKSRKARNGSVAVAIIAVVIAITVVVNIVAGLLTDRFPSLKFDVTQNKTYALQDTTIDYMSKLSKDVTVTVLMTKKNFESGGIYLAQANAQLEKMQSSSKGKLTLKYIDLNQNPTFTSKYPNVDWTDSSKNNLIMVECGDQYRALTLSDCFEYDEQTYYYYGSMQITANKIEKAVVTAVLNVTTDDKILVNIITGNQEQDSSGVKSLLENNAYEVEEVSLATGELNEKAVLAVLYAPSVDLDDSAVQKISQWLDNDGKYGRTFIFIPTADMPQTPNIDSLLSDWGMQLDSGYVFETDAGHSVSNTNPYAFIAEYTDYYVDGLKNKNIPVAVRESHAVNVTDDSKAHGILITSDQVGIWPLDAAEDLDYTSALTGQSINIAAEGIKSNEDEAESKLVVFGSYLMFASDIMTYNSFNNSAYLLNLVNTVSNRDSVDIAIENKATDNYELGATSVAINNIIMIIFVIIVPLAIIVIGIVVWLRRRNK